MSEWINTTAVFVVALPNGVALATEGVEWQASQIHPVWLVPRGGGQATSSAFSLAGRSAAMRAALTVETV